jgi:hypothetical protein
MATWDTGGNAGTNPPNDYLGTSDNQALVVKTNATEHVRIDASGNVGIGTQAPAFPLHLPAGKTLRIEGGTGASDTADYFSFGGNGTFGIDAVGEPNGRFVVQNDGTVGIGAFYSLPIAGPKPEVFIPNGRFAVLADGSVHVGFGSFGLDIVRWDPLTRNPPTVTPNGRFVVTADGQVGIGAPAPRSTLEVQAAAPAALGPTVTLTNSGGGASSAVAVDFNTFLPSAAGAYNPSTRIQAVDTGNFGNDIVFLSNSPGAANNTLIERMRITSGGNVSVPGDIVLTGADCAEHFDVLSEATLQPGTVVVIADEKGLRECDQPYDKRVAGVVSGAGDFRPALVLDKRESDENRAAIALIGKVFCMVDASFAPVEIGDLLTTSSTLGHAMKASDRAQAFGCILGKALRPLKEGRALIPILVALQ